MEKRLSAEEIRAKYYEEKAFDELKNIYFPGGWRYIDAKYGQFGIDPHALYRRIVNYRIKKFGTSFIMQPQLDLCKTSDERLDESRRASKRRKSRLGR